MLRWAATCARVNYFTFGFKGPLAASIFALAASAAYFCALDASILAFIFAIAAAM